MRPIRLVLPDRADTTDLGRVVAESRAHIGDLVAAAAGLEAQLERLAAWSRELADRLGAGGRLLVAGNGGSAAEAQHLTAELVGRFSTERRPYAALALHADTSTVTAVGNDYGFGAVYARQVTAHARPGDVVLLLSTSGRSPNLVAAAEAAHAVGASVWALTGPGPNPLADAADEAVTIPARPATVQELHLVAVHLLCAGLDSVAAAGATDATATATGTTAAATVASPTGR